MIKYHNIRGYTVEEHLSGWFSVFVFGHGYLKADSLNGIKKLLDEVYDA